MVWGCMTYGGVGYLCKIDNSLDAELYQTILADELINTLERYGLDRLHAIFQQDNDPKHTAESAKRWLRAHKFKVLDWPPRSPNLNPNEHLWDEVDLRPGKLQSPPPSTTDLWEKLQEVWNSIDHDFCRKLIGTVPQRVRDVHRAIGGYTRW
jgi:hypothetical protein